MPFAKVIEAFKFFEKSFKDTIQSSVDKVSESVRGISSVNVIGQKAIVGNNKILEYRVVLKVAFTLK